MSNRMNRRRSLAERQPRNCLKRELPQFWRLSNKTRKLGNTSRGITALWRRSQVLSRPSSRHLRHSRIYMHSILQEFTPPTKRGKESGYVIFIKSTHKTFNRNIRKIFYWHSS